VARVRLRRDVPGLRLGHPWVYRDALERLTARAGDVVEVADKRGALVGRGFADPRGPIGVRILSRERDEAIDEAWVARRVGSAAALRRAMLGRLDSDGVRLLHGENDFVPGLVIDAYGRVGVVQMDGEGAAAFWRPRLPLVEAALAEGGFPLERIVDRTRGESRTEMTVSLREGAARYEVDVGRGQKTGFFLDQRENRRRVAELAAGADVLNVFGYTGGFSVAAALGGARRVATVDLARPAIDAARKNLERNGVLSQAGELHAVDAFAFLEKASAEGRRWDVVVTDPPSFAPSEKAKPQALAAYRRLARLSAAVVTPGGILAAASCSSHVGEAELVAAVAAGIGDERRTARLLELRGAAPDHPVAPSFPEGRYLKLALVAI
jgi:23S rRNA (cytosine1962-C5)-methyltransferase